MAYAPEKNKVLKKWKRRAPVKAGHLAIEDLMWFYDMIDEVKDELPGFAKPQ